MRFRCSYPGCGRKYASTDGCRKHARKEHPTWLARQDAYAGEREPKERKPSTYCIREDGDYNSDVESDPPLPGRLSSGFSSVDSPALAHPSQRRGGNVDGDKFGSNVTAHCCCFLCCFLLQREVRQESAV